MFCTMHRVGVRTSHFCLCSISERDTGIRRDRQVHKSVGTASGWLLPEHQAFGMEWRGKARGEAVSRSGMP